MKGKFIVFEGIDGCGKTTQINEIYKWLPVSGLIKKESEIIKTREPGGSRLGRKIRELILSNDNEIKPENITELLLYYADRSEHISKVISPALNSGNWVLSDRFTGSTLAYQGYGRNINIETIRILDSIICKKIRPDITIFLEISPEISISRRINRIPDRIESEGMAFLKKVDRGFKLIAKKENWKTVNSSNDINTITNHIKNILIENLS